MTALLTLILQCVHVKRNVFTLYQEEYFLYTMSLWVCYRNSNKSFRAKIFLDRCYRGQTRADLNAKKNANESFGLIVVSSLDRHELNFFPGNLFLTMVLILFRFFMRAFTKKAEND